MAKLGRRERFRRKTRDARQLAESLSLGASRPEDSKALQYLSRHEQRHLLGMQPNRLDQKTMESKSHTLNAYVGRSPGTGKPDKVKRDRMRRAGMGKSYQTAFMAAGHEGLKAPVVRDTVGIITGVIPEHGVMTVDKKTGEKRFIKVASRPRVRELVEMEPYREVALYLQKDWEIKRPELIRKELDKIENGMKDYTDPVFLDQHAKDMEDFRAKLAKPLK